MNQVLGWTCASTKAGEQDVTLTFMVKCQGHSANALKL